MPVLFNLLYLLLLICVSPWILWRSIRYGRYRRGWKDKLYGLRNVERREPHIWLHAVSVGELQVLRPIVEFFEGHSEGFPIAISVSTDSAMELAQKTFNKHCVFYAPFDFTWSIRRTFDTLKPRIVVLAELELWPNWLLHAEDMRCPVVIINGRLSEASFRGYARIRPLLANCMKTLDWVGVQSPTYAARFEALGVPAERITTTGNIKFDGAVSDRAHPEVLRRKELIQVRDDDLIWTAGSTQSPEEEFVLRTFLKLYERHPQLRLILVPRHPERFQEVAELIQKTDVPWIRRSTIHQENASNWRILLADSIGELRWWWGLSDIGFVGGSFGDRGGQNMIEPCAYGVATCFGPNTKNFRDIVRLLLDANACEQLRNPEELEVWIEKMILDQNCRNRYAEIAASVCAQHRGASITTWNKIVELISRG